MTRQADVDSEARDQKRRDALYKALSFDIVGALDYHGAVLRGLSIKYDENNVLLTVRADRGGHASVCFIGSDSIVNCILKLASEASHNNLHWKDDRYHITEG